MFMLAVGLTGGIASGKSEVAQVLQEQGCLVYDADKIAHRLYEPDKPLYQSLILEFGKEILNPDQTINRKKLGELIFQQPKARQKLNELVHPAVREEIKKLVAEYKKKPRQEPLIVQVPLLIEAKMTELFDCIVVVITSPELQYERLQNLGLTEEQILARLRSQLGDTERLPYADFTLINKSSLKQLQENTLLLYRKLIKKDSPGC